MRRCRHQGFTLPELLITVVMVGVVFGASMYWYGKPFARSRSSLQDTIAQTLEQAKTASTPVQQALKVSTDCLTTHGALAPPDMLDLPGSPSRDWAQHGMYYRGSCQREGAFVVSSASPTDRHDFQQRYQPIDQAVNALLNTHH